MRECRSAEHWTIGRRARASVSRLCRARTEQIRVQRQRAGLESVKDAFGPGVLSRRPERDEQRKKMLFARMRTDSIGRPLAIRRERVDVVLLEPIPEPVRERLGVAQRLV